MEIREVSIKKLNPAKYNPRKDLQPDDPEYIKLKRSMEEFGDVDPIVWNEQTGNIIGGHQRFKIYQEMGHKKIKVSVVNLTEKAEAVLNIALNKISGEWDYPKLKDLISEIDTGEFDIDLTGFDQEDLDKLFGWGTYDDNLAPDKLEDVDIAGEDTRNKSFILVYTNDDDKEFFMQKLSIDGKKRVYTREDFE